MPLATFRHSARAAAPAGEIWDTLQAAETWGGVGLINSVSAEEHDDRGDLISFRFTTSAAGRTWEGTATRISSTPGESLELALLAKEIRGRIDVDLTPDADHTILAMRLEIEPAGMLATLFWGAVRETIASGFDEQVEAFAAGLGS